MSNIMSDVFEKSSDNTYNHPAANSGGFGMSGNKSTGGVSDSNTTTNAGGIARDNATNSSSTRGNEFADEVDRSFGNDIRGQTAQVIPSYKEGGLQHGAGNTTSFSEGLKGDKDGRDGLGGGVGGYGDARTDTYDSQNQSAGFADKGEALAGGAIGAAGGYGAYQFGKDGSRGAQGTGQEIGFGSQVGSNTATGTGSSTFSGNDSLLPNNFSQELKGDRDGRDALGGGVGGYGDSQTQKGDFEDSSRLDGLGGGVAAGVGVGTAGAAAADWSTDKNQRDLSTSNTSKQDDGMMNPKAFMQEKNLTTGNQKVDNFAGDKLNAQYQQRTDKDGFTDLSTGEGSKAGLTGRAKLDSEDPVIETTKQRSEKNDKGQELDSYGKPYTL